MSKLYKGNDINIEVLKSNQSADRYPVRGELYAFSEAELKDRHLHIVENIMGNIEDWEYKDRVLPVDGKYPALLRYFDRDTKEPYYSLTAGQLKYLWLDNTNIFEAEVVRIDEGGRIICRYLGLDNIILSRNGLINKFKVPRPGEKFTAHLWNYDRYLSNIIVGQFDKQEIYQNSFNTIYFRYDKAYDFMDEFNNDHKQRFLLSFTDDKIYFTASTKKYYLEIKLNKNIGAFEILSKIHKTRKKENEDSDEYVIQRKFQGLTNAELNVDVFNKNFFKITLSNIDCRIEGMDDKKLKDIFCTEYKKSDHTIIGCTSSLVSGLGYERLGKIDLVIFDEAGRCTLPETLAALICAKKLVLVGDQKQLPPVVDRDVIDTGFSENKRAVGQTIKTSLFEELITKLSANRKTMLDTQYRMDKKIGNIVSTLFYDGQLKTGKKDGNSAPASSIKWFSVNGAKHKRCPNTKSLSNYKEGLKIMHYLNSLAFDKTFIEKQIVVITPYTSQLKMLQQLWQHRYNIKARRNLSVAFTTIDAFQGREAGVIIYSAVMTSGAPTFIADRQRLNVAFSRARENFILFGHEKNLCQDLNSGETNPFIALRNHFDAVIYV